MVSLDKRPRARLGFEQMEDRCPAATILGVLDFAGVVPNSSTFRLGGWAYDPDSPSTPVQVHLYINGQYAFAATTGGGANQRFAVDIPTSYLSGQRTVVAYGIDVAGGDANAQLSGAKHYYNKPGDAALTWQGMTVHTSSSLAGAIDSMVSGGYEYIDRYDHGREVQTAMFGRFNSYSNPNDPTTVRSVSNTDPTTTPYNPTEAGTLADGLSIYRSSSELTNMSVAADLRSLSTTVNSAEFEAPANTDGRTNFMMSKIVGTGAYGMHHTTFLRSTIVVPSSLPQGALTKVNFQPPIIFTNNSTVSSLGYYNPSNGGIQPLGTHVRTDWPVVMVGANGERAISIVTRQTGGPTLTTSANASDYFGTNYAGYTGNPGPLGGGPGNNYGYLGRDFQGWAAPGQSYNGSTFVFESYISIGSAATVTSELNTLHSFGIF